MKAPLAHRCLAEGVGAFAIVFLGCGAAALLRGQPGANLMVNGVFGLAVAVVVFAFGRVSAAHFNPAVSVGFAVAGRFAWREVPAYVVSQFAGALFASGLHAALFGELASAANYGATVPAIAVPMALAIEGLLTFLLMFAIFCVARDRPLHPAVPAVAIGSVVGVLGLFAGAWTGCSMNPARSLGPAAFVQGSALGSLWIYLTGPIIGAAVCALGYVWLRGRHRLAGSEP